MDKHAQHVAAAARPYHSLDLVQVATRLVTKEAAAGLIAEACASAEVRDADEGKEFGRGKRVRCERHQYMQQHQSPLWYQ